ncbi:flagellar brake protein [Solimicrobium silvestre]|uniref:Flagellar protein YcgR n=1 Tax=Solimicrobium silvestre TaxID=2099400 RepID=A0A2S9GUU7_9BURK|nr:flagellar brake protein [Solimicrobium silvestre]PRC91505.1 Flagellar protein YcgR [Solimicrobium silvestre]
MADLTSLIPLSKSDFAVGKVTQRSIYDRHGKLLLASGVVIESQNQLNGLVNQGYVQKNSWDTPAKPKPSISAPAKVIEEPVAPPKEVFSQMDDVRWYVGETLHMQALNDTDSRFVVKLIGYIKGKSVLVTAPVIDGKYILIRDNQTFVVRAFQGKKAFAFTVTALKSVYTPHPYLHLSYPKQVNSSVIRHDARAAVKIIASVSFLNPVRTAAATLLDLSMGGTSGIIKQAIAEKKETGTITFKINVVGNEGLLSLDFIVRSIAPTEEGDGYRYGFEFLNVPAQHKLILSAFVHQTIAELV